MSTLHAAPDKDQIALLEPFEQISARQITLVATAAQAQRAIAAMQPFEALGFDTESKPTFVRDEVSSGPHIVQFSTLDHAYIFQLHDPQCSALLAEFLHRHGGAKVGFGLGDDNRRIAAKLGVQVNGVVDLNHVFRHRGYRKDMGVKAAVALLFNRRYLKSKKAATSNWANPQLTPAQLSYAANDAYAAMRVYQALQVQASDLT